MPSTRILAGRASAAVPPFEVGNKLKKWLTASRRPTGENRDLKFLSLRVSGKGGGQWHLVIDRGRLVGAGVGLRNGSSPTCYLNSNTFARLSRGKAQLDESISSGKLVVAGSSVHPSELAEVFAELMSEEPSPAS